MITQTYTGTFIKKRPQGGGSQISTAFCNRPNGVVFHKKSPVLSQNRQFFSKKTLFLSFFDNR